MNKSDKILLKQVSQNDADYKAGKTDATGKMVSNFAAITEAYLRETGQASDDAKIKRYLDD